MSLSYIFNDWVDEYRLRLPVYRDDFIELPWIAIVITIVGLFIVSGFFVKSGSPSGTSPGKEKISLSQLIVSGMLLSLTGGFAYALLPGLVMIILWIYLLPLLLGLISGVFCLLTGKGSLIIKNLAAIFAGNFYVDTDRSEIKGIWQMLSKQLWEQPQTLIGNGLGQILNSLGLISHVQHTYGATIIHGKIPLASGVAFGSFILVTNKNMGLNKEIDISDQRACLSFLIRHELGHSRQSRCSGPLYLWKYGIPSALSQAWTEIDAEARSDGWLLLDYGITPAFKSYPKNHKFESPGIPGFLFGAAFLSFGILWGGYAGLVGAYLFISGIFTLLNLGKRPSRFF